MSSVIMTKLHPNALTISSVTVKPTSLNLNGNATQGANSKKAADKSMVQHVINSYECLGPGMNKADSENITNAEVKAMLT